LVEQIQVSELERKLAAGDAIAALPGSLLIPLAELEARHNEIQATAGSLVVVYCHHGIRSLSAAALLAQLGLPNAVSLAGGIDAWSREVDPRVARYF
jgi:adenylyltransferase/sulfurtransferase